jgi:hypothetical protein
MLSVSDKPTDVLDGIRTYIRPLSGSDQPAMFTCLFYQCIYGCSGGRWAL